jgi:EmrB/QacA subfamily drug resistance transporter
VNTTARPWPALWALCLGFFMILVDTTIVSVATPAIMIGLHADINSVIWVTSAYLLAFAVPLLITGRLGDRFGPKNVYLLGLALFTLASAWCGLSGSITMLIAARVLQGLGAALMTPQTMAVITRTFPPGGRGAAMGMWGSVAGVATLVGPLLGGVLVDSVGWEWIFYVNVPVGVVGFVLAMRLIPQLPTHSHRFDVLGVMLSAVGMFCLVFGIQEGETYHWGTISGPITVWRLIGAGVIILVVFLAWQVFNRKEPLLPLALFKDRNFSLANIGIGSVGFTITGMALPLMLFAQNVRGLSPTRSALLLVPMAVISGAMSPFMGRVVDRVNPKYIAMAGLLLFSTALFWLGSLLSATVDLWLLVPPIALLGLASSGVWAPLSTTATRNLPMSQAGAGAGVYNTTRQIGAVLGSAGIAAIMEARLAAHLPPLPDGAEQAVDGVGRVPAALHDPFATAMGEAMFLPAATLLIGFVAVLFLAKPQPVRHEQLPDSVSPARSDA